MCTVVRTLSAVAHCNLKISPAFKNVWKLVNWVIGELHGSTGTVFRHLCFRFNHQLLIMIMVMVFNANDTGLN